MSELNKKNLIKYYFFSFWNGNITLWKTFWLGFFPLGGAYIQLVALMVTHFGIPVIMEILLDLLWLVYISVAFWRSASKYQGRLIWDLLTKIFVVLNNVLYLFPFLILIFS